MLAWPSYHTHLGIVLGQLVLRGRLLLAPTFISLPTLKSSGWRGLLTATVAWFDGEKQAATTQ